MANHWHLPLPGHFGFQFDYPLPIPQRPVREERRRSQLDTYLQTQFELSQPGQEIDRHEQPDFNGVAESGRLHEIVSSRVQSFQRGAASTSIIMISCLSGVVYYVVNFPANALCAFNISIDWWLMFAFFFAVMLSPIISTEWTSNKDGTVRLVANLEYELVQDFRRWGMLRSNRDRQSLEVDC